MLQLELGTWYDVICFIFPVPACSLVFGVGSCSGLYNSSKT